MLYFVLFVVQEDVLGGVGLLFFVDEGGEGGEGGAGGQVFGAGVGLVLICQLVFAGVVFHK